MLTRILIVLAAIAAFTPTGVVCAEDNDRELRIELKGLPADTGRGKVSLKAIRVQDSSIASQQVEDAGDEFYLDVPSTHLLLTGTYLSLSPAALYQGAIGSYSNKDPVMTMTNAAGTSTRSITSLPTYPPSSGMAIGYNRDQFTVSGPGTWPGLARGLGDMVVCDLVSNQCSGRGDNSYVVVASADPGTMALIEGELELQKNPAFDPSTRVTPHTIRATHMLKGNFVFTEDSFTAYARIEDMSGNVIATSTETGTPGDWWNVMDRLGQGLAKEACKEKPWKGTITAEWHIEAKIPNSDPQKGPANSKTDLSMSCKIQGSDADCNASFSSSLSGNGTNYIESGSDSVRIAATAGFNKDGTFSVYLGRFYLPTTATLSVEGGSQTAKGSVQLGGWEGKGPATQDSPAQSGSSRDGELVITWSVSK